MGEFEELRRVLTEAMSRRQEGAVVVALDGRSGVGKSTLAAAVARDLGAAVVHGDDFYRDMSDADRRALSPAEGVDRYFDWERLRDEALIPLRERRAASFRCFDWAVGHGLGEGMTIEPRDLVIVEGVYSARPELEPLIDLRVLVALDEIERGQRLDRRAGGTDRHAPSAWDARWDAAERVYFDTIRPEHEFDLVIDGQA